ncbi:unnamed protein product [Schistocephalus solidus]|uniref:Uncharacterized protein n=1 Tax=Schistocephalus solidus TaxID=70667 RepID=A0A183TPS4_SCHSO|nr:unnamed protein product [Schistocephalus solidus]
MTRGLNQHTQRVHVVNAHSARESAWSISVSTTPALDPTTMNTRTTDNNFIDDPPSTITDTILPPPLLALLTVTNTTCRTPNISVATSDYLPPATSNTTATPYQR